MSRKNRSRYHHLGPRLLTHCVTMHKRAELGWECNCRPYIQTCIMSGARKSRGAWAGPCPWWPCIEGLCQLCPCRTRLWSHVPMSWHASSAPIILPWVGSGEWDPLERSRTPGCEYHQQAEEAHGTSTEIQRHKQQGEASVRMHGKPHREARLGPVFWWPQPSSRSRVKDPEPKYSDGGSFSEWPLCSLPMMACLSPSATQARDHLGEEGSLSENTGTTQIYRRTNSFSLAFRLKVMLIKRTFFKSNSECIQ